MRVRRPWRTSSSRLGRMLLDGGPPPETSRLLADALRARARDWCETTVASVLPVRGGRSGVGRRREGVRRWAAVGALTEPVADLAHHTAGAVRDALTSGGLDVFLVGREGHGLVLGLDIADRQRAWRALTALGAARGGGRSGPWHLAWRYGGWRGVHAVGRGWGFLARRGTSWRIFQQHAWGDELAVGSVAAVTVTFWAERPDGLSERVGVRGPDRFPSSSPSVEQVVDGRSYPGRADLPVSSTFGEPEGPIDVVVTWVDGSDPVWRAEFEHWRDRIEDLTGADGRSPSRYRDRGELRYVLRSVWAYAGWARHIFLVTSGQVPSWLDEHERITVVPHSEIFPADALPTFSSHAIESRLHHVPGLVDRFVYLNDDVFLARPVRPSAFFTPGGLPKVSISLARVAGNVGPGAATVDLAARNAAELIRRDTGRAVTHKPSHGPFALRRDHLVDLEQRFAVEIGRTTTSRFRSPSDVSVASFLAPLHALATGRGVESDLAVDYVNIEHRRLPLHLARLGPDTRFDAFCLNETERIARDQARVDAVVGSFLAQRFPVPAPWEHR